MDLAFRRDRPAGAAALPRVAAGSRGLLAAILAGAVALRVVGIQYGLPFGTLLNPDEQSIVPRAWKMVHGGGADPGWFDYPTLTMYLLAPFQAWQDRPSFLTARILVALLGTLAVALTWWLGRRAYGTGAGLVAATFVAVETTGVAYSHMAVTDIPLTAGVAGSLALMVAGRIELAGLVAGLATSAKYPGVFLVVPLVVAGFGRWRRLAVGLLLGAAGFLAGSPYVAVHPGQAWQEATRVQRLAREGWLGFEDDSFALFAFSGRFWHTAGPAILVVGIGLVAALFSRRRTDLILASFVVAYAIDLLTLRAHFDRYLLPLVPAAAVLAGRVRYLAAVTMLLLAIPLAHAIKDDIELTKTDTRVVASAWIRAHVPQDAAVAAESSTPSFDGYPFVPLLLPGPGRPADPNRDLARLRRRGVDYVVITGAVADRVLAARGRYAAEKRFYADLRRRARRVYYVAKGPDLAGPWVAVYRIRDGSSG